MTRAANPKKRLRPVAEGGRRSGGGAKSSGAGPERSGVVRTRVPATSDATWLVRRSLDELGHALDDDLLYELRLLATELVTNSLRHGGLEPDDSIGIDVEVTATRTRVEVSDNGRGFVAARGEIAERQDDDSQPYGSGWGLRLVERLSDRWGVDRGDSTKLWFEIDTHAGRRAGGGPGAAWDLDAVGLGA